MWLPFELDDHCGLFATHEDGDGTVLDFDGRLRFADGRDLELVGVRHAFCYVPGTRRLRDGEFTLLDADGGERSYRFLVTDRGLRTVVDLRAATEVREAPGGWTERGVSTVHCPLPLGGAAPIPGLDVELVAVYLGFLERDPAPLLAALDVLLDPGRHPALVHCAAGKDRTGVVSAILLALLGVPRPVIAADFALTATRIDRVFDRLSASAFYRQRLAEVSDATRAAEPATILAFLAAVDERHGGLERWLTAHRIDAATLERFRAALLER